MTQPRLGSLLTHLSLALAGVCLTVAEVPFLPELPLVLAGYLLLIGRSWRRAGQWMLPGWAANLLAVAAFLLAGGWMVLCLVFSDPDTHWLRDVPLAAALIPFLGPALMGLTLIRLYQPRSLDDFRLLHGLGLLQVALGCVLGNTPLFGVLLLGYLVVALCALAAFEMHWQSTNHQPPSTNHQAGPNWWFFGLRWGLAVSILAVPLFLFTPRVEGPEWDPFSHFGLRRQVQKAGRMGFSDEIDLTRTGTLQKDDSVAFTVSVSQAGVSKRALPIDQRWRGIILDRYEDGIWRSDLNWPSSPQAYRPPERGPEPGPGALLAEFRVSSNVGSLFLADPVVLDAQPGFVPVVVPERVNQRRHLFFEVHGTILPVTSLGRREYRYLQILPPNPNQHRWPAVRLHDGYLQRLLRLRPRLTGQGGDALLETGRGSSFDLPHWTRQLLLRLISADPRLRDEQAALLEALERRGVQDPLPPMVWEAAGRLLSNHLAFSREYGYSLTHSRSDETIDPVADFLVNVKQGTCERYASALVLMLRSLGIPARLVKGYRGAEYNDDGHYEVLQSHAHAWVETLVPAEGPAEGPLKLDWLVLDPTPSSIIPESPASVLVRWWQQQQRSGQSLWRDLILGYNSHQRENLISAAGGGENTERRWLRAWPAWLTGALALGVGGWLLRQRRRSRVSGILGLYQQLRVLLLERLGLPAGAARTPQELSEAAATLLLAREPTRQLASVPGQIVRAYYQARYGGRNVAADEVTRLSEHLQALTVALE